MKNYIIYTLIGLFIIGGVVVLKNKTKPKPSTQTQTQTTQQTTTVSPTAPTKQKVDYQGLFGENPNLCEIFPKEKIEELLGKTFVEVKNGVNKTSKYTEYYCEYYQEEAKFKYEGNRPIVPKRLPITILTSNNINELREAYKLSGFQAKQDSSIPFPHQLIYDQQGKFRTINIFLTDNMNLGIHPFQSNLTQEEALDFVKKFALYFKEFIEGKSKPQSQSPSPSSTSTSSSTEGAPLPTDEDILRNFVSQIEEGKPDQAAKMMKINDQSPDQANSELQAWAVQFSNITSFKLLKMEKANEDQWTDNKHIYKVVFDVWMDPRSADAPIPYYGWENGENTRWLTLEKVGNLWKIAEIATGP